MRRSVVVQPFAPNVLFTWAIRAHPPSTNDCQSATWSAVSSDVPGACGRGSGSFTLVNLVCVVAKRETVWIGRPTRHTLRRWSNRMTREF